MRLAGDAVRVAQPDGVEASATGDELRARAVGGDLPSTSRSNGCVDTRGVSPEQIDAIAGRLRPLAEVLTEVAGGRSGLVYMGG